MNATPFIHSYSSLIKSYIIYIIIYYISQSLKLSSILESFNDDAAVSAYDSWTWRWASRFSLAHIMWILQGIGPVYSNCSKKPYSYLVHAAGCRYGKSGVRRSVPSCAYNTQHVNFLTILLNGLSPERKTTLSEERSSSTSERGTE
jgi:hypothetical protein